MNWAGGTILSQSLPTVVEAKKIGAIPTRPLETELRGVEGVEPAAVDPECGPTTGAQLSRQGGLIRRGDRRCDR